MEKDIKYLGVPNVCFSLTDEKNFKKQRIERGFDDSETWALDCTIANFIIPRLERYIELTDKHVVKDEKHIKDINIILEALKLIVKNDGVRNWTDEEQKLVFKGLEKFSSCFLDLTW